MVRLTFMVSAYSIVWFRDNRNENFGTMTFWEIMICNPLLLLLLLHLRNLLSRVYIYLTFKSMIPWCVILFVGIKKRAEVLPTEKKEVGSHRPSMTTWTQRHLQETNQYARYSHQQCNNVSYMLHLTEKERVKWIF